MTKVDYTNLFSTSRQNVVDLISTNVSDPISTSNQSRKWIYSRQPDVKNSNFKGYPFIVISNSNVNPEIENQSGDGKHRVVNFDIEIEIMSSDRGYGSSDGKGSLYVDSISDSIFSVLLNLANRNSLINDRMSMSTPVSSDVEVIQIQNELIYRRSIILSFKNRMVVSV